MKRMIPTLLALFLLSSMVTGMDFNGEKALVPQMNSGRAAGDEIELVSIIEPKAATGFNLETNTIDVGEEVNFRLAIANKGSTTQTEAYLSLEVWPSDTEGNIGEGATALVDVDVTAIDPDNVVTHVAAGDWVANGNYFVPDATGSNLGWTPSAPGTYVVIASLDAVGHDTDLTNNEVQAVVNVIHYQDISLELVWDGLEAGEMVSGTGPHDFTLTLKVGGSNNWDAREPQVQFTLNGDIDAINTTVVSGESVVIGEASPVLVETFRNETDQPMVIENRTRTLALYDTEYTYTGSIFPNDGGFSLTARIAGYTVYGQLADCIETWMEEGGENPQEMSAPNYCEVQMNRDDRPYNDAVIIQGFYNEYNDISLDTLTLGPAALEGGRVSVGTQTAFASVRHRGSDPMVAYNWSVEFELLDLAGNPISTVNSTGCEDQGFPLGQQLGGDGFPLEAVACADLVFGANAYELRATVSSADDENTADDSKSAWFEGVNNPPSAWIDFDSSATYIIGDLVNMVAKPFDVESEAGDMTYTWERTDSSGGLVTLECQGVECTTNVDDTWVGTQPVYVTVGDEHGGSFQASVDVKVWNVFSSNFAGDDWSVDYSLTYLVPEQFTTNFTAMEIYTDVTLGESAGLYTSAVAYQFERHTGYSATEIASESMTITYPAGADDPSLSLWYSADEVNWAHVDGTQTLDQGLYTLTWEADASTSNLPTGYYALFAASAGGAPPDAGITDLTATQLVGGKIQLDWTVSGTPVEAEDSIIIFVDGVAYGNPLAVTETTVLFQGENDVEYLFEVKVTNGEFGEEFGSVTLVADAAGPTPTVENVVVATQGTDELKVTWNVSAGGDDVAKWKVCWALEAFDEVTFQTLENCMETTDDATELVIAKPTTQANHFFGIAGIDALGNNGVTSSTAEFDLSSGVVDPGEGPGDVQGGDEEEIPSWAWGLIIGIVVVAFLIGAWILSRGGGDEEGGKDWDY